MNSLQIGSSESEHILYNCRADCLYFKRRRSGQHQVKKTGITLKRRGTQGRSTQTEVKLDKAGSMAKYP